MARIDDILLNAYIDGELSKEDAAEVTMALREDPEAARRLACLQRLNSLIHQAYDPILEAPLPDRLAAATVAKNRAGSPYRSIMYLPVRSAIAASIVAALIAAGTYAGTSWHLSYLQHREQAARLKDDSLQKAAIQQALERERSGNSIPWVNPDSGKGGAVVPVRTFQDRSGAFCREFHLIGEGPNNAPPILAVACRNEEGVWKERFRVLTNGGEAMPLAAPDTPTQSEPKI